MLLPSRSRLSPPYDDLSGFLRWRVIAAKTPRPAPPSMTCVCRGLFRSGRRRGEILAEPAAQQVPDPAVALAEHEVVGIADEEQLGRLSRALEHLDRLLRGRDGIVGGVQQQE